MTLAAVLAVTVQAVTDNLHKRKPQQAIETFQKVLGTAQQLQDRQLAAFAFVGIGLNLRKIGQPQQALDYFNFMIGDPQ